MEASRGSALYVCSVLFLLTEVTGKYVHIHSLVRHGIIGRPLHLAVEPEFSLNEADIQGTWFHNALSGTRTTVVTFDQKNLHQDQKTFIMDMNYRDRIDFKMETLSLLILKLEKEDEGRFYLNINIRFPNGTIDKDSKNVMVTVDVPISTPLIEKRPSYPVIEGRANITWTCSAARGTRVKFQWFRDNVNLTPSERHHFSHNNSMLVIDPVTKDDRGNYSCVASNPVSPAQESRAVELSIYYGPYNLEVNSIQGLRTGPVFTINPGERTFFDCQADSNPPNSYVWISKSRNDTHIVTRGPRLQVVSYQLAQAEEYLCRAFNNVTQKQDETRFTLVVAKFGTEKEKQIQDGGSAFAVTIITASSLFIIGFMVLFFIRRTCHPKRVLMNLYNRPFSDQKPPHRSGHEDATEDFGIYEFVSIPGRMESTQASCKSLARLESIQDMHTTIYDVIRHVPESPSQNLLT